MKPLVKFVVFGAGLLAFGALRMPFEAGLTKDLRAAGLISEPLEIATRDRIGQTSSAVALGGLRTLVATFLNLRAFTFFTEQRWADVESTFDTIVDLAPRTRYYWDTGAWHMTYNAASYHISRSTLPALRRREAWRSSIVRGRAFLERGIRNNPGEWHLYSSLGMMLSDSNKFPAFRDPASTFEAAADAYAGALATGNAPPHLQRLRLYALARVPGREREALELARSLYDEGRFHHLPTLLSLLFVLEVRHDPEIDPGPKAVGLFGTEENAYRQLSLFWGRTEELFPTDGVAGALQYLERRLDVPPETSIFNQNLRRPTGPDQWFDLPPDSMGGSSNPVENPSPSHPASRPPGNR